jgi:MFS family permease
MTTSSPAVTRLTAPLYGYAFVDNLILLYPLYALLFSDTGLAVWQISSLFVLWSLSGMLLEVPSGAWADAVSRRRLLCLGPLLSAAGFALWLVVPSYWAFALGFVLWGAKEALGSGALEALVYEELDRLGAAGRYARTMGRARAGAMVAAMASMGLAGPVFAVGGYAAVGAASVLACLLTALIATRLPEHAPPSGGGEGDWAAALRAGLAEARGDRAVRGALLLVAAVTGVWGALDEYTPLLTRDTGVSDAGVPWLLLLIWTGATLGGLLAGLGERWRPGMPALLALGALALAAGAALRTPAGIGLVAVAFCAFQAASVLADAHLQERIAGPSRATVTSLSGVATGLTTIAVYATYAAFTVSHATAFVLFAIPYLVTALHLRVGRQAPSGG